MYGACRGQRRATRGYGAYVRRWDGCRSRVSIAYKLLLLQRPCVVSHLPWLNLGRNGRGLGSCPLLVANCSRLVHICRWSAVPLRSPRRIIHLRVPGPASRSASLAAYTASLKRSIEATACGSASGLAMVCSSRRPLRYSHPPLRRANRLLNPWIAG